MICYQQYYKFMLLLNMTYPSGKIYQVNMVFPLCLFVVDIQGAHKLVGMFDSYSQVERPCISCDCRFDDLDNLHIQFNIIIHDDMYNNIMNKSKALGQLLNAKSLYLIKNYFSSFYCLKLYLIYVLCYY